MTLLQTMEDQSLIDATRALLPQVASYGDRIESERRLPQPLVDLLVEAGLFKMLVPKSLGGSETEPEIFCRVLEELSTVDGSTGWSVLLPGLTGAAAACLEESVAWEIFGKEPNACIAGSGVPAPNPTQRPPDRAIAVEGGYQVTGRWSFSSACMHSTGMIGVTAIYDGDTPLLDNYGKPETRYLFFPISECQIIDSWDVAGFRGSGSHDFAVTDVFVARDRSLPLNDELKPLHSGSLYKFTCGRTAVGGTTSPWTGLAAIGTSAVCLGIARGALDALIELASVKSLARGKGLLRDNVLIQDQVGRAEAALRAARAFLYETIREVWESVRTTGPCTLHQQTMLRLAGIHAAAISAQVVDITWNAAGSSAIFASNPFERRFRDIHVVSLHAVVKQDLYSMVGRMFLGLDNS